MSVPVTSIRPTAADNAPSGVQAAAVQKAPAEAATDTGPASLAKPTPAATIQVSSQARQAAANNSAVAHKHKSHPRH